MVWYACGQVLPSRMIGDELEKKAFDQVKKCMPSLVPTTYEAAEAYLLEELKKPEGGRNLLREMCLMLPMRLPKDRTVSFVAASVNTRVALTEGECQSISNNAKCSCILLQAR